MSVENKARQIIDGLLFPKIFRSFRLAVQPSQLIIAFLLIAAIGLAGWIMDLPRTVVTTPGTNQHETELSMYMNAPAHLQEYIDKYAEESRGTGVFSTLWDFSVEKFHRALKDLFAFNLPGVLYNATECLRAIQWAIWYHPLYCAIFGVVMLCLVSIFGGAICRIAALQFSRGEKPEITEAIRYSRKKFMNFAGTPLVPAAIIAIAAAIIFSVGLLSNIPLGLGELITAVLIPIVLVCGAVIAIALAGTITGLNLMFPSVAYDGSDGLEAVSRSFNYVLVRPWRLGIYTLSAIVYGAICYAFVRFFAFLVLWSGYQVLRMGAALDSAGGLPDKVAAIWTEPSFAQLAVYSSAATGRTESAAAVLVYLVVLIVVGVVVSFIISFYYSASTVIYALLRHLVDNTPIDEVYTEPDETRSQPGQAESPPIQS